MADAISHSCPNELQARFIIQHLRELQVQPIFRIWMVSTAEPFSLRSKVQLVHVSAIMPKDDDTLSKIQLEEQGYDIYETNYRATRLTVSFSTYLVLLQLQELLIEELESQIERKSQSS